MSDRNRKLTRFSLFAFLVFTCCVSLTLAHGQENKEASRYKAASPRAFKFSGAPLFESRAKIKACFAEMMRTSSGDCFGRTARVLVPKGSSLLILQKYEPDYVAKVRVLDGKAKGKIGYIHEAWIDPSPW